MKGALFSRGLLLFAATALVTVAADLATKLWVQAALPLGQVVRVTGFFALVHVENRGASFSLLAGLPDSVRVPFFLVITAAALGVLLAMARRTPPEHAMKLTALALVFGGALGNFVDRARQGVVVDFLLLHAGRFHWPVFNVADIGITVGIALLLLDSLREARRAHAAGKEA